MVFNKHDNSVCGLVALFHMPPWYPWLRLGRVKVKDKKDGPFESIVKELFKDNEEAKRRAHMLRSRFSSERLERKEHHALLLPLALWAEVKRAFSSSSGELDDRGRRYLKILDGVLDNIAAGGECWRRVLEAGDIASSFNRLLVKEALRKAGLEDYYPESVFFVNMFAPRHVLAGDIIDPKEGLSIDLIVEFIKEYARLVVEALKAVKRRPLAENDSLVLHISYLLLEPVWYKTTSIVKIDGGTVEVERLLVPPADPRVPIHTVFDYINSVLSTLILLEDGCIVLVDLAGVQEFISESRRLRDLWAASWLASFLAWASVRDLVLDYGPGVLVMPPGRLHPFYSALIMGDYLDEIKNQGTEKWLLPALGIPVAETAGEDYRWPALATVPSLSYLALPREICRNNMHRRVITSAYRSAWSSILNAVLEKIRPLAQVQYNGDTALLEKLFDTPTGGILWNLEPPLSIRIYEERVGLKSDDKSDDTPEKRAVAYNLALVRLTSKQMRIKLTAPGRTSGEYSYKYAKTMHDALGKEMKQCLVCGKLPALIDGEEASMNLLGATGINKVTRDNIGNLLSTEIFDERLCPYCLVKRLLRSVLKGKPSGGQGVDLAKDLVGMSLSYGGLPTWDSVNDFTTRLAFITEKACRFRSKPEDVNYYLMKMFELIVELFDKNMDYLMGKFITDAMSIRLPRIRVPESIKEAVIPKLVEKKIINSSDEVEDLGLDTVLGYLWYMISESLISEPFLDSILEKLEKARKKGNYNINYEEFKNIVERVRDIAREFRSLPRRYGVLVADGDHMGKGLLQARLPRRALGLGESENIAGPREYLTVLGKHLEEIGGPSGKIINLAVKKYALRMLEEAIDAVAKSELNLGVTRNTDTVKRTLYTYPSYHFTVSRSLSLLSQLDLRSVTRWGGQVVYAGGDDVLAIVPPATLCGKSSILTLTGLKIASETRKNWWASNSPLEGFLVLVYSQGSGSNSDASVLHFAPAPAAYGRSSVLFLADALYPMWLTLTTARMLEELKDEFKQSFEKDGISTSRSKDLFIVASDSRGLAYTTSTPLFGATAGGIEAITKILEFIYSPSHKRLSHNVLHDLIDSYNSEIVVKSLNNDRIMVARKVIIKILKDNLLTSNKKSGQARRIIDKIIGGILKALYYTEDPSCIDYALNTRLTDPTTNLHHILSDYSENPYLVKGLNNFLLTSIFSGAFVYSSALPSSIKVP